MHLPDTYTPCRLGASRRDEALALMRQALGTAHAIDKSTAYWQWKHEQGPFGASWVLGADVGEADAGEAELAALRVLMRWTLVDPSGAPWRAARPVDTATHPDHRRRGLFGTLTRYAVEALAEEGVDLLFNTPNEQSRPGYLKMGWSVVARWPLYARPVAWGRVFKGSRSEAVPFASFERAHRAEVAELVTRSEATRRRVGLRTLRTGEYLRWRYAAVPDLEYLAIPLVEGTLQGFAVGRVARGFRGIPVFVLTELVSGDPAGLPRLVRQVVREAPAAYVMAHAAAGTDERAALRARRFVRLPGRGYTFVARPVALDPPAGRLDVRSEAAWDLTVGELEIF